MLLYAISWERERKEHEGKREMEGERENDAIVFVTVHDEYEPEYWSLSTTHFLCEELLYSYSCQIDTRMNFNLNILKCFIERKESRLWYVIIQPIWFYDNNEERKKVQ